MSSTEGVPASKTLIAELATRVPLVVIGVLLIILAAVGKLPYGGQEPLVIGIAWRNSLFALGLILIGIGVFVLLRDPILTKKRSLLIDVRPLRGGDEEPRELTYAKLTTVDDLLDKVWYSITPRLPEGTYGQDWVLCDSDSGHLYREIGRQWATEHGRRIDDRPLEEVNIKPGMRLEVRRPKRLS